MSAWISEGAAQELAKSAHATELSDYEKILFLNCDNCLRYGHPGPEDHGPIASLSPEYLAYDYSEQEPVESCSVMVALGPKGATKDGRTIMVQHDDGSFSTQFYRVMHTAIPDYAGQNSFFSQGAPGKIFEIAGVNSKGVAVLELPSAGRAHMYLPKGSMSVPLA